MNKGIIFDIKRYAIHDGPGIRTTVFLKGCPLRCRWCHNPEGISGDAEIMVFSDRCIDDCRKCVPVCDNGAINFVNGKVAIAIERCTVCGSCALVCPTDAIVRVGRTVTLEEVMTDIEKDRVFYEESRGGVTFSGGEPLAQPEFLMALLALCRQKGIHTVLDTSVYAPVEVMVATAALTDLFLYDFKLLDRIAHRQWTGQDNDIILENLKHLTRINADIIIRIPVIPGVNDTDREISQMAEFLISLDKINRIDLLPFHQGAGQKYRRLHHLDQTADLRPLDQNRILVLKEKYESFGFTVHIGG